MAYGMIDMIRKVTDEFDMTHIEEQIRAAMLKGDYSVTFSRDDTIATGIRPATGKIHHMQAVKLARDGYTVERSLGGITISGWADLNPYKPE